MSSYKIEIARLYEQEYGQKFEFAIRNLGTFFSALMIYLYTGWISAWVWCGLYFSTQAIYYFFLCAKSNAPRFHDVIIAIALFLLVYCAFIWMPALLIVQQDEALKLAGCLMMACVLVFLIRRAEHYPWMAYSEIGLMSVAMIVVIGKIAARSDSIYVHIALPAAGITFAFYLTHSIKIVRQQRIMATEATERSVQSEKMEAIGQLAGGVAHDFNNLLTAVIGNLELYEDVPDPKERAELIANARRAAMQGADVVKMLLHYSRQSDGDPKLENVNDLLRNVANFGYHLIRSNIQVIVEPTTDEFWVRVDESQITAAIMNLISNGSDAIVGEGTITLSATKSVVQKSIFGNTPHELRHGTYVEIKVTDTGAGIPKDIMPRVIDPFFTTKPKGKGSGLGLSMVSGLAQRSGGKLWLESSPNGTQATIALPLVTANI